MIIYIFFVFVRVYIYIYIDIFTYIQPMTFQAEPGGTVFLPKTK